MKVDLTQEQINFLYGLCADVEYDYEHYSVKDQRGRECIASEIQDIFNNIEEPLDDFNLRELAHSECVRMMSEGICHPDDVEEFYMAGYRQKERG